MIISLVHIVRKKDIKREDHKDSQELDEILNLVRGNIVKKVRKNRLRMREILIEGVSLRK